jgi:outer membrane receptor for ferric coprogen and ferric-rhodotorulic acid
MAFGRQSAWQVSVDQDTLAGQTSQGAVGRLAPVDALGQLLSGTGVTWRQTDERTVVLEAVGSDGTMVLDPVRVQGAHLGSTTDGTGSYTTGLTSTATGLPLTLKDTPQSVTVMTRARMEDQNLTEIGRVLEQVPGISANVNSSLGTDAVQYYARGFEVNNYQVDGASRPTTVYGFEVTTADTAIYDRVEVVRGATGLLNGVGNPSATVNLVRKRPKEDFGGYVEGQVGSWQHGRAVADLSAPLTPNGAVRGRVVLAKQDNETHLDREHIEKHALYGVVEADLIEATVLTFGVEYQDFNNSGGTRGGLPLLFDDGTETDFDRSTNTAAGWTDFSNTTTNIFSSLEHGFDNGWSADLKVEYSQREYDEVIGYVNDVSIAADGTGSVLYTTRWAGDLDQITVEATVGGPYRLFGREHDLMVGASYSRSTDESDNYPGWWSGGAYSRTVDNVFEFLETGDTAKADLSPTGSKTGGDIVQSGAYAATRFKPLDHVSLILGTRVTNWEEREWSQSVGGGRVYSDKTVEHGVITPYGGAVVDVTDEVSAYVSYAEIFDPQSNEDITGSTLDPKTGVNYELGVKGAFLGDRLNASAAVFRVEQDNLAVATGILNPNGKTAYVAEEGTSSQGFEVEITGEARPGWQVGGGYSHTTVEDNEGSALMTYLPEDTVKIFTTYRLPGAFDGFVVGTNLRWQGKVYFEDTANRWPGADIFEQGAVTVVDLMARYEMAPMTLTLNVDNLFDKKYYSGINYTGTYGRPRSVLFTAKYDF